MKSKSILKRIPAAVVLTFLAGAAQAQINPKISGLIETYLVSHGGSKGVTDLLTWAELRARIDKHWSALWSGVDQQSYGKYDEAYARYEIDDGSLRAGRMRTSFGFSDWSELFYNGFNHVPLVREFAIVGTTQLDREDCGAEATANFGQLQVQAATLDVRPTKAQVGPDKLDYTTVTAQYGFGSLVAGGEILTQNNGSQKVYGATFRYTVPHWIARAEFFQGVGPGSGNGGYADVVYRIPALPRTELVARYDQIRVVNSDAPTQLETVGIRHIFNRYVQVNLNYGWGKDLAYSTYAEGLGLGGWTARVMFQVQF